MVYGDAERKCFVSLFQIAKWVLRELLPDQDETKWSAEAYHRVKVGLE